MPGPSSRTTISTRSPGAARLDLDAAARRRIFRGIVEKVEQRLLGQHEVERQGRQVGRDAVDDHPVLQQRAGATQSGRDQVADVDRLALGHDGAGIEPGHVQKVADEAVEPLGLAQRRAQKLVAGRPRRSGRGSSAGCDSAPMIEASGVRRSCDTEVSMAERRRSRSAPSRAWSISSASVSRSMATAAWLPTASSRRCSEAPSRLASFAAARRSRRSAERLVRIGTNSQRPPGKVSVPRPVGRSASHDQRAAARSASLSSPSGGKAALRSSCRFRRALLRHQDHDLGVEQAGQMGDDDPQQVVEVDDAGDLAAEGIELGGGARLAPRRLGLRARARGERAGGDRHEHEEEQRQEVLDARLRLLPSSGWSATGAAVGAGDTLAAQVAPPRARRRVVDESGVGGPLGAQHARAGGATGSERRATSRQWSSEPTSPRPGTSRDAAARTTAAAPDT